MPILILAVAAVWLFLLAGSMFHVDTSNIGLSIVGVVIVVALANWLRSRPKLANWIARQWPASQRAGLTTTGILIAGWGIALVQSGIASKGAGLELGTYLAAAGLAVVLAGLLAALRIREDLVQTMLAGIAAVAMAVVMPTLDVSAPSTFGNLEIPAVLGVSLVAISAFSDGFGAPRDREA